ncbi:MAG TPA: OmpA family protein [Bryobacteraceae bacterium]|nr:OmpA family protein [Bryobacteraceae bacterium]
MKINQSCLGAWKAAGILLVLTPWDQVAGEPADSAPLPAVDYVVRAFDRFPIVALGEAHGAPETQEFIARVIEHPGFAGRVSDVVVEFGTAKYQGLMDQYILGRAVPREELRRAWENTTQISGVWSSPIYENFFAFVRSFNQKMPESKKIRVLLGDPPIDWKTVIGPADEDMNDWRDAHVASVVEHEVIRKGRKALLFIGGAHISRRVLLPNSLIHLLDARLPEKTLVIQPVNLSTVKPEVSARLRQWPTPAVLEVRGTWLGGVDVRDIGFFLYRGRVEEDFDVLLHLSAQPFKSVPVQIDPNSPYARELKRRQNLAEATLPFRGGKIRFDQGSVHPIPTSEQALRAVLAELQRDRHLALLVKAYADEAESNAQQLSNRRAEYLRQYLIRGGIDPRRLTSRGCGASRPAWASDTEEHKAANRRAELVRRSESAGCQPPDRFNGQ